MALEKLRELDLDQIAPNPFDACPAKAPARLSQLIESVNQVGLLQPITVTSGTAVSRALTGKFVLIDGHTRLEALRALGRTIAPANIVEISSPRDLFERSYALNECRRSDAGAINHAIAWQKAISEGLYASADELAERLGLHKSTVSRVISLTNLPPFVTDAMKKNPERVGIRLGMALIQYHGAFGTRSFTRLVDRIFVAGRQEVTAFAVEAAVASGTHFESTRGLKPQKYSIFVNKREGRRNGALRIYPSGRLVLDVSFDDLTIQEQVGEAIREVFERQFVAR